MSPVEAVELVLARISALQPHFNAYRAVDAKAALQQARASETRWAEGAPLSALDGVPDGFKDLLNVRGFPTRKGSLATSDAVVQEDSPSAARLRDSGAVLLGKTQTVEFGLKGLKENRLGGVTPDAWDRACASSGSSGGAAVAAALGLGPLQVGADGGGSIRAPAATNGEFGFKPTLGRVAGYPHNGACSRSARSRARSRMPPCCSMSSQNPIRATGPACPRTAATGLRRSTAASRA